MGMVMSASSAISSSATAAGPEVAKCQLAEALEEIAKLKQQLEGRDVQVTELTRERDKLIVELKDSRIQAERSHVECEALRAQLRQSPARASSPLQEDGIDEGWLPVRRALRETSLRLKLARETGSGAEQVPADTN